MNTTQLKPHRAVNGRVRAQHLPVLSDGQCYQVPLQQIVLIQTTRRGQGGCLIRTADGRIYRSSHCISRLQNRLPYFWRVGVGHLVNPEYVQGSVGSVKYQGELWLTTGQRIAVYDVWKERLYMLLRLQEAARQQNKQLGFVAANFVLRCN
jgi:hypothetical protein